MEAELRPQFPLPRPQAWGGRPEAPREAMLHPRGSPPLLSLGHPGPHAGPQRSVGAPPVGMVSEPHTGWNARDLMLAIWAAFPQSLWAPKLVPCLGNFLCLLLGHWRGCFHKSRPSSANPPNRLSSKEQGLVPTACSPAAPTPRAALPSLGLGNEALRCPVLLSPAPSSP